MNNNLLFLLLAALIIGALVVVFMKATGKRANPLDKEDFELKYRKLAEALANDASPMVPNAVLVEADKLLDKAMLGLNYKGNNMGERLRSAKDRFSALNSVWHVHKIRNQIAHQHGFSINHKQAAHALGVYKKALQDLGAL